MSLGRWDDADPCGLSAGDSFGNVFLRFVRAMGFEGGALCMYDSRLPKALSAYVYQ